jgi:hypothetical protein
LGGAGAVLRGPLAIGTAGLWAVMALSADLFPLAMSYLVFYRCTDQRPTERSLPQMWGEGEFLEHILHKGELTLVLEMDHAGPKVCVKHVSKVPRRIEVP